MSASRRDLACVLLILCASGCATDFQPGGLARGHEGPEFDWNSFGDSSEEHKHSDTRRARPDRHDDHDLRVPQHGLPIKNGTDPAGWPPQFQSGRTRDDRRVTPPADHPRDARAEPSHRPSGASPRAERAEKPGDRSTTQKREEHKGQEESKDHKGREAQPKK